VLSLLYLYVPMKSLGEISVCMSFSDSVSGVDKVRRTAFVSGSNDEVTWGGGRDPLNKPSAHLCSACNPMRSARGPEPKGVIVAWLYCLTFAAHTWAAISSGFVMAVHVLSHVFGSGPMG
jgi:hypothetical protein